MSKKVVELKEEFIIEKYLKKDEPFTQEEKNFVAENLDAIEKDESYELLKRKFYHELEGFDLEISSLKMKDLKPNVKNREKFIKELEREKQELIDICGFFFGYKA